MDLPVSDEIPATEPNYVYYVLHLDMIDDSMCLQMILPLGMN